MYEKELLEEWANAVLAQIDKRKGYWQFMKDCAGLALFAEHGLPEIMTGAEICNEKERG